METVRFRVWPVSRSAQLHRSELSQNFSTVSEVGLMLLGSMSLIWEYGSSFAAIRSRRPV
ncbi:hypothetical protein A5753_12380 [Mycobacterium sp. 852002-51971_SCH5477799-a]|nr:hypothetical protein A5753_12380 [Mycobacterium sp. 852002-51971_SCH5477799-a]